ncbi:MAG: hypothetical protein OEZ10_11550 [Gammaproteobacteria bacterium]|nr:hypothetical protein [Gammaproteobacteria bacterium]
MPKVSFTNKTDKPISVGPVTVFPGKTREVEQNHLHGQPGYQAPEKPAEDAAPSPVLELLDGNIKDIAAAIQARDENGKPVISDDDLAALKSAEQDGNTRKGVMEAIAAEELLRATEEADAGTGGGSDVETFIASLKDKSDEELIELSETHADEPQLLDAINTEIDARN